MSYCDRHLPDLKRTMSIKQYAKCQNDLPIICRIIFVRDDLDDKLLRALRLCKHRGNSIVIMRREICQGGTLQSRAESALELTKMLTRAGCTEKVQNRNPPGKVEDLMLPTFRYPGVTLALQGQSGNEQNSQG
jgi:hypothetical protein